MFNQKPEDKTERVLPPDPVEKLIVVLRSTKRGKPKMLPSDPRLAAEYWIAHQEPGNEFTEGVVPITKNEIVTGWKTPYHNRLVINLKKFLSLKPIYQVFVIEKFEVGIPWRGDDMPMFTEIVKEHEKMNVNKVAYIQEAHAKLNNFTFSEPPEAA